MQKKLLALAVAGVLAAPVAAMAQSSVTISGVFKVGIDQYKIGNPSTARAGLHTNEMRVTDNSSRIIFGISEDMGGGTYGIAQLDMRPQLDAGTTNGLSSGNSWVGIRGTSWGTVTLGRHDLHYGKQPDDLASKAGALMATAVSLMDFTYNGQAIANATRTNNVIRYDSPNWSGFAFTAAYSTNPTSSNAGALSATFNTASTAAGQEADLQNGGRQGNAYTINPSYTAGNFAVGYSYWKSKTDLAITADTGAGASPNGTNQTSSVIYGYWKGGGFKVGAAMNKSKTEGVTWTAAAGETTAPSTDRTNWTIPVSWTSGAHNIYAHYTRAGKDKVGGDNTDAKMYAVAYAYDLSKRTSVGVTYAKIDNNTASRYNFFTNTGGLGSVTSAVNAGEDPQLIQFTIRHGF
jgi:predicted porin